MSGIAGILDMRDGLMGGSIDLNLLHRMTERLQHRGPDGISFWSAGPVGLAHAAMHTTPESEIESQPHSDALGWYRLTFDGRIDNRKELRSALESAGQRLREDTDVELVLCAYAAWGEQCAARLLGDFAFALWDNRRRQLFCARDIMGLRPFYYSLTSNKFLFASEPRALLESPDVSREPNEAIVAEYLRCDFQRNDETLFRGIFRLVPAHCVVVSASGVRFMRYWKPDPLRSIRYSSDQEYADHFLDLFRDAIRQRMRVNGRFGSFLSGGMDSSSIVSLTLELLRENGHRPSELNTFSMVFPGHMCDESAYILEMESIWGQTSNKIAPEKPAAEKFPMQAMRDLDFAGYPNGDLVFDPLRALARAKGIRVLLSGMGGDEWFTGSIYHYADFFKRGKWGKMASQFALDRTEFPKDRRQSPVVLPRFIIPQLAIMPLMPESARQWIRKLAGRGPFRPPTMSEALWQRMTQAPKARAAHDPVPVFPTHAQRDIARALTHAWGQQAIEMLERSTAHDGMEFRFPFEDRRLIEFGLAIPEDQRWRGLWTKFVVRNAMKDRLPESVRLRRTKSDFSDLVVQSLLQLSDEGLFTKMTSERLGWVSAEGALRSAERLREQFNSGTSDYTKDFWRLWMTVAIELWARALFGTKP